MKVTFLGAGASKDSGYPLTKELFSCFEKYFNQEPRIYPVSQSWEEVKNLRSKARGKIGLILKSSNPEIALSLPDIFRASLDENEKGIYKNYYQAIQERNQPLADQLFNSYKKLRILAKLTTFNKAFSELVDHYFSIIHCQDSERKLPEYLKKMLLDNYCIITTNWDTLSERVLMNEKKWFPSDGYGFQVKLLENRRRILERTAEEEIKLPKSQIRVYKLHGSIGWRCSQNKNLYLRYASFLQYLHPNNMDLVDEKEPNPFEENDSLLICPSYLKQLDNRYILNIWDQARDALCRANEVVFVGYSLPLADVAIRALLSVLRTNDSTVKVISPSNLEENERWESFFSDKKKLEFIDKTALEHFC